MNGSIMLSVGHDCIPTYSGTIWKGSECAPVALLVCMHLFFFFYSTSDSCSLIKFGINTIVFFSYLMNRSSGKRGFVFHF